MEKINYRRYKDSDFADLIIFFEKIDKDFFPAISKRKSLEDYLRTDIDSGITFLSYISNNIVGMINLQYNHPNREECYINTIGVHSNYRKKGIASGLIKIILKDARQKKFKKIKTRTWSTNNSGLKLYQKFGFVVDFTVKNDRGKGIDSIYLKKLL
jgi:[ribosomal protein S18]-alanine N-acetyltransferase